MYVSLHMREYQLFIDTMLMHARTFWLYFIVSFDQFVDNNPVSGSPFKSWQSKNKIPIDSDFTFY